MAQHRDAPRAGAELLRNPLPAGDVSPRALMRAEVGSGQGDNGRFASGANLAWSYGTQYMDVDLVAPRARCVHLLDVERMPRGGMLSVLAAVRAVLIAEQGTPERHHVGTCEGIDGDLDGLHADGSDRYAQRAGHSRDLLGQLDVCRPVSP